MRVHNSTQNSIKGFCLLNKILQASAALPLSDIVAISYMKDQSKGLLSRWYLKVSKYFPNLTLEHKPGKSNKVADALSQAPIQMSAPDEMVKVLQICRTHPEETLVQNILTQLSQEKNS